MDNIKKLEQQREERRRNLEEQKQDKKARKERNAAAGKTVDCDYDEMIEEERNKCDRAFNHISSSAMKICVCVRKRPLFGKETEAGEIDAVSCGNPKIFVHEPKIKVDGITKYI